MKKFLRAMLIAIIAVLAMVTTFACGDPSGDGGEGDGGTTTPPAHEHTYATEWSHDESSHWHAATCEHTTLKKDEANHTKTERVILNPTYTTDGKAQLVCTCGWKGAEYVLDKYEKVLPTYETPTPTAVYGQNLADVVLPDGFTWELEEGVEPAEVIFEGAGEYEYTLTYIVPNDTEEKYRAVHGIEVTLTVNKATPSLVLSEDTAVWTKTGVAINPEWYATSTEGTTAVWDNVGNVNPLSVGTHYIKLIHEGNANYEASEERFEFTVVADTTISKAFSWDGYEAKTPTAVSYDKKIADNHTRDGQTAFSEYVAGVDYTENFNTDNEKSFSYKAKLTSDGLYFIATVHHDLILSGSTDWGANNNLEGTFGNKGFYLAVGQVVGSEVNSVLAASCVASYSIDITEVTGKNYKYESVYTGLIPLSYLEENDLIVEGEGGKEDYVRFALAYRGGTKERIVLCVPTTSATIDTATNSESILAGTYGYRTVTQNTINAFVSGNTKTLTVSDNKYMLGDDIITLTRVKSATENIDGTDCYLYYVDYPDFNDSFYSTSAHTMAKPFIVYPEGHSPYNGKEHGYVTADGISYGYTATEAVIDGKATDTLWNNYNGYLMYAYEQGDNLPSKSKENSNARGRGVEVKAIVGDDGVYIFGTVTHSKYINYTHRNIWNNAIELQFALTPQTANWDNNSSNGYKGSAGTADEPFQLKSFVFTETGYELHAGTEYYFNTEWDGTFYVSTLEAFISWGVFQNRVSEGIPEGYDLRAGIQYRSFSEYIYLKGGSASTKTNIWSAHNTITDYGTGPNKFFHIDANGLHATRKTDTRFAVDGNMADWKNTNNYSGNVVRIEDANTGKWVDGRMALTADGLYFAVEAKTHNFWRHVKDSSPCMLLDITIPKGSGQTETIVSITAGGLLTSAKRGAPLKGVESISVGTQIEGVGTETKDDDRYNVVIEGFIPMWFINEYMSAQVIKDEGDNIAAVGLLGYIFSPGAGDKNLEPFMYATWRDPNTIGSQTPSLTGNMYVTATGLSLNNPVHQHTYSDTWSYDDTKHWHAATCEHTTLKTDEADHVKTEQIITHPTYTEDGSAKQVCDCGWESEPYAVPKYDQETPTYTTPTGLTATYGQTLADVALPEGFAWELETGVTPADVILNAGEQSFTLSYTVPNDPESRFEVITGIAVTVEVAKATPVLILSENTAVWTKEGIAINPAWYASSTDGTIALWNTANNANPTLVGTFTIKLVHEGDANYEAVEETFEFTVTPDTTISKAFSWDGYEAKTPTAVSYDKKIADNHTRDGQTAFSEYVAGVDYTENYDTNNEKGFSYKAQLTDDGLYFIATVHHDLILTGSTDFGNNNNIEGTLGNKGFYLSISEVEGLTVKSVIASTNIVSYSVVITEATDKNYKYETVYTGLIPTSYLVENNTLVEGTDGKEDYVRFALSYRGGTKERIVLCVPTESATIDTATNSESISAGTYAFRIVSQNTINAFVAGNTKTLTISDSKYMLGDDIVTLTRVKSATENIDGTDCYLYYVDYPEYNDSFYSTSAHTAAKPFIIYPEGHSPFVSAEHGYVTADGISYGYTATEAVIDGKATDTLWTNYNGYMMYAYDQGDTTGSAPSKSAGNVNARGRGVEVKAIVGDDGVYIFGTVTHSKYINYTHRAIWNNAIQLQFGLTPQTSNWDNNSSNGYMGSAGTADEAFQLKGFVFTETGYELYAGTEYYFNTEWDGTYYVSTLEAFISWGVFQNRVSNGIPEGYDLRVGIQYRSFSEYAHIHGLTDGVTESKKVNQWYNANTLVEWANANKFFHVDENGLHATRKTDNRFAVDGKMDDWNNTTNYTGNTVTVEDTSTGKWVKEKMVLTADGLYFAAEAKTHTFWRHIKTSSPGTLLSLTKPKSDGSAYEALLTIMAGGYLSSSLRGAPLKGVESMSTATLIEGAGTADTTDDRYNVVIEGFIPMWFINEYMSAQVVKDGDNIVAVGLLGLEFNPAGGDKGLEPFVWSIWRDNAGLCSTTASASGNMYVTATGLSMTVPTQA